MATITDTVRPGDVISSDLINRMIALLNTLSGTLDGQSGVVVPNLFGRSINDATAILRLQSLALGMAVDTTGTTVDPIASGSGTRLILSQVPVPGQRTFAGGAVNVVVASSASGGSTSSDLQLLALVPAAAPVNTQMELQGIGFSTQLSQNIVTFNGIAAPVQDRRLDRLVVLVPTGIPNAPTAPGQPNLTNVTVRVVRTTDNRGVQLSCTVLAPLANPLTISSIAPNPAPGLVAITITGIGFSTNAADFDVIFDETIVAAPSGATSTQLTVTIPNNIPGLINPQPGAVRFVRVQVRRKSDNTLSPFAPQLLEVDF